MKSLLLSLLLGVALSASGAAGPWIQKFIHPPDSTRPWVYWFWMDGNLSREGITADLEAMQRAGIGGMIIMEVDAGIPRGPVPFMSEPWRALFIQAVTEAERLGLEITLNAGPGWTGSGGPWVKPEQSMQHIVASETNLIGGSRFEGLLPLPPAKAGFYRDVAVHAFPTPSGDQRIPDIREKALYDRQPYSSQPNVKPYLPAPAHYPPPGPGTAIARDCLLDLSQNIDAEGRLTWDVPEGHWTVLRFGRTSTGANTRPAPEPGTGLECDKFDTAALDAHFDAFVGTLLRELGPRPSTRTHGWTMLHMDSWEMGAQNWTARFREEFQRRRGYDPLPFLPAVTGRVVESLEISERFLWDLRQTSQELVVENHAGHLKALGRRHGFGLSIEPYDMNPCSDLSLGGVADVPMCEFWAQGYGFNTAYSCIEAVSIAHTTGRPIVAAESFTADDSEAWRLHPGALKAQADWAFCAGINRLVIHRYAHQPWLDRWPGMTMGPYGVHYERTQTWWDFVPAWHQYLARCQYMLRQGVPVADICYLLPEGAPHVFRPPSSALRSLSSMPDRLGYNFDGCAPETVLHHMSVKDRQLVLPSGMRYTVLVLPNTETMTPALLKKISELIHDGATVIGPPPLKSPSLSGYPQCDQEVRRLAMELWTPETNPSLPSERFIGMGKLVRTGRASIPAPAQSTLSLSKARWIWHAEGSPAAAAPVGHRYFRRCLNLDSSKKVESARLVMTADNSFEVRLNGQFVGGGSNFHQTYEFDVASLLHPGTNQLSLVAENGGSSSNPAGLIGILCIQFQNDESLLIPTDHCWESTAPGTNEWRPALDLGPLGMAPWGVPHPDLSSQYPPLYSEYQLAARELGKMMGLPPDFESDVPLRYNHRRDGDTDIYFVANPEDRPVKAQCLFRVSGKLPSLWDPVSGRIQALDMIESKDGQTRLPLDLEPHGSIFVLFQYGALPDEVTKEPLFPALRDLAEITGPWEVRFQPNRGAPERTTLDPLGDWSKHPKDGVKHFSGIATYLKTFQLPSEAADSNRRLYLDLGRVQVMARVKLNGRDLGVVWKTPFRLEITSAVRPGNNLLEISVANLWPNRLIGDQSLSPEKRIAWTTWHPYKKDSPLLESGLLGPVMIQAEPTVLVPGVVIDHSPASSGIYIGSPSLAVLPNGDYVASHDEFGPKSTEHSRAVSHIFQSRDRGQSWKKISTIQGAFWSTLFTHRGALYLIGPDKHHGNLLIRRSSDGGVTWTSPMNGATGLLRDNGEYHCAPVPVIEHAGHLWRAIERRDPPVAWGINYRAGMLSIPVEADLLVASNWTCSNFLPSDRSWNNGDMGAWLEGNAVITPAGQLVNMLRVQTKSPDEKAAIVHISPDGQSASFDPATGFIKFPGGAKKFTIRFDPQTKRYWSLATIVPDRHLANNPGSIRNTLALTSSSDLAEWTVRCILLYHPDTARHGFQYVDWLFDGEDIIAACRTAFDDGKGGAHNNHDANFLTFHRFANFRRLTMSDSVPLPQK